MWETTTTTKTEHINRLTGIHLILSVVMSNLDAPGLINIPGVHTAMGFFSVRLRREFVIRHAHPSLPDCGSTEPTAG